MTTPETNDPNEEVVRIFWQVARETVGWGSLEALLGQRDVSSVIPPAVSLDEDPERATTIAQDIRDGKQTQLETPRQDYAEDGQDLPRVGDLLIVCDGRGIPLALIRDTAVTESGGMVVESFVTLYPELKHKK